MSARLVGILICVSSSANAVELSGRARASVHLGVDSNPRRDFTGPDGGTPLDGAAQAVVNLSGGLKAERIAANATYDLGARKFALLWSEDTIIQSLQAQSLFRIFKSFGVGVSARARDRRGANREYTDLSGEVSLQLTPISQLDLRGAFSPHRFIYWSGFFASFWAPEATLLATYRFTRRHSVTLAGLASPRTFNSRAQADPSLMPAPNLGVRKDTVLSGSVQYSYRGPWVLSLSYGYLGNESNSYGWSFRQHRLGVVVGLALPWKVTAVADVNVRFSQYVNGIAYNADIIPLDELNENLSSAVLRFSRPINDFWDVEAHYGFYFSQLPRQESIYLRHVASVGISFHL